MNASAIALLMLLALAGLALAALVAVEVALRVWGFAGFPLFARDPHSVYRMASSQQGRFRRARWRYDRFGMRSDEDVESLAGRIVVLGDSVVEGGVHLDQDETLAAALARETGWSISPVACHGWALTNELGALTSMPGWERAAALVWVVNSGDFDTIGRGESEYSFPTSRPRWLAAWLLRRHIYRTSPKWWPWGKRSARQGPRQPELRGDALARFTAISAHMGGRIIIVGHALRGEDLGEERFFAELAGVRPGSALVVPAALPGWGPDCYIDFIHPSARGAAMMARAIAPHLPRKEP